jgi:cytochrome c5
VRRSTLIVALALAAACKAEPAASPSAAGAPELPGPPATQLSAEAQAGHRLYAVCHSCHDPELDPPKGPPMFGVQRRYQRATDGKEAFIARMVTFVETPTTAQAVMTEAVANMGVMPALPLGQAPLRQLAAYIYEAEWPPPCAHWAHALERQAAAGVEGDHARQDHRMYEKFCK